jgi:hypothetical protein
MSDEVPFTTDRESPINETVYLATRRMDLETKPDQEIWEAALVDEVLEATFRLMVEKMDHESFFVMIPELAEAIVYKEEVIQEAKVIRHDKIVFIPEKMTGAKLKQALHIKRTKAPKNKPVIQPTIEKPERGKRVIPQNSKVGQKLVIASKTVKLTRTKFPNKIKMVRTKWTLVKEFIKIESYNNRARLAAAAIVPTIAFFSL